MFKIKVLSGHTFSLKSLGDDLSLTIPTSGSLRYFLACGTITGYGILYSNNDIF